MLLCERAQPEHRLRESRSAPTGARRAYKVIVVIIIIIINDIGVVVIVLAVL